MRSEVGWGWDGHKYLIAASAPSEDSIVCGPNSHAIVSSTSGPEYYVSILSFVDKTQLEPGCTVLLHNKVTPRFSDFMLLCTVKRCCATFIAQHQPHASFLSSTLRFIRTLRPAPAPLRSCLSLGSSPTRRTPWSLS